jgi:hypothetical protein
MPNKFTETISYEREVRTRSTRRSYRRHPLEVMTTSYGGWSGHTKSWFPRACKLALCAEIDIGATCAH